MVYIRGRVINEDNRYRWKCLYFNVLIYIKIFFFYDKSFKFFIFCLVFIILSIGYFYVYF